MIQDPVFIIGTERSGSNLLRLLLNAHPNLAIPHPPHIMRDLSGCLATYGDLYQDASFARLSADVARLVNLHFAPWPTPVDAAYLFQHAPSRSLYGIYSALYEQYRLQTGKRRWGCKSTFMFHHVDEILAHHSAPCFLHLTRDPRDVAASAETSIFSRFHPYKAAELWVKEQNQIETWAKSVKLLRVRYEDLTAHPEYEMKRVMEFLGEDFQINQLLYFASQEAKQLSRLSQSWKKCNEPVSTSSVGRFRTRLTTDEIGYVETQAGALMTAYGYPLALPPSFKKISKLNRLRIEISERVLKFRAEMRALSGDKNFFMRWRKWLFLRKLQLQSRFALSGR